MPSKSKKQQRLMGMAYAYSKEDMPNASDQVKDLAKSFMKKGKKRGLKKLRDFASTKHDNLKENKIQRFEQFNEGFTDFIKRIFGKKKEEKTKLNSLPKKDPDSLENLPEELQDLFMHMYREGFRHAEIKEFAEYCNFHGLSKKMLLNLSSAMPSIAGSLFIIELNNLGLNIRP
jgi:hypothetical protein